MSIDLKRVFLQRITGDYCDGISCCMQDESNNCLLSCHHIFHQQCLGSGEILKNRTITCLVCQKQVKLWLLMPSLKEALNSFFQDVEDKKCSLQDLCSDPRMKDFDQETLLFILKSIEDLSRKDPSFDDYFHLKNCLMMGLVFFLNTALIVYSIWNS